MSAARGPLVSSTCGCPACIPEPVAQRLGQLWSPVDCRAGYRLVTRISVCSSGLVLCGAAVGVVTIAWLVSSDFVGP